MKRMVKQGTARKHKGIVWLSLLSYKFYWHLQLFRIDKSFINNNGIIGTP